MPIRPARPPPTTASASARPTVGIRRSDGCNVPSGLTMYGTAMPLPGSRRASSSGAIAPGRRRQSGLST
ncbi:hypothetical protein ACFQ0B_07760 [Nonomuraea thailandensis]